jgi:hypothetical protein
MCQSDDFQQSWRILLHSQATTTNSLGEQRVHIAVHASGSQPKAIRAEPAGQSLTPARKVRLSPEPSSTRTSRRAIRCIKTPPTGRQSSGEETDTPVRAQPCFRKQIKAI